MKLLLHYLVLDHYYIELYGCWVLQVNKTDGWLVQQQKKRLLQTFLLTGEQRRHFGHCSAAHSNGSSRSGEFSSYNVHNSTFFKKEDISIFS